MNFFHKIKGGSKSPQRVGLYEIIWSWAGAFLGILPTAYLNYLVFNDSDFVFIVGSFGASAVLLYGAPSSPLAQPRNLMGGHIISALIGVFIFQMLPHHQWLAAPLAVATAIAFMHGTNTLHPPGGATALIAVMGSSKIHALGYTYAFLPIGLGAGIMLIVALIVNNISKKRRYPVFWI